MAARRPRTSYCAGAIEEGVRLSDTTSAFANTPQVYIVDVDVERPDGSRTTDSQRLLALNSLDAGARAFESAKIRWPEPYRPVEVASIRVDQSKRARHFRARALRAASARPAPR
jgi:hypothetical protein